MLRRLAIWLDDLSVALEVRHYAFRRARVVGWFADALFWLTRGLK